MKGKIKKIDPEKLPVYQIIVEDNDDTGIQLISLVDDPAITMKGMAFSKPSSMMSFKEVSDKQVIVGPALIPDMKIYREDEKYGKYYVTFSAETISKMVEKFNKFGSNRKINIDHSNQMVDAFIMEDWIVEDAVYDKSKKYGFEVPVGTYMIMVKIEDTDFWNEEVKGNGKFGFSIEGMLGQQLVSLTKQEDICTIDDLDLQDLLQIFNDVNEVQLKSYSDYGSGVRGNAKRVLEWTEKNGWGSCGTPVGKVRANQLAKGKPISLETIKRMYSYLSRHEVDLEKSKSYSDGCGKLMYDSWGGKAALGWSRNKLRELGELNDQEFKKWRVTDVNPGNGESSNVSKIMYNDETFELVIKFENGDIYTYSNVDFNLFKDVWQGRASCVTDDPTGQDRWWYGKSPSVGAAVYKKLVVAGVSYVKGGSFR